MNRRQLLKATGGTAAVLALGHGNAVAAAPARGLAAAQDRPRIAIWSPGDSGTVADWSTDPILQ
ncbi:MAG: twin-arginine translocation signal domain-containing protein, partial [Chloroflexota bacterium]|nr:twin-arginine translocation signal domain-containing protein [Chloroflexota bacterium]